MRISRTQYRSGLRITNKDLIKKIATFPEHGMDYALVDVTLFDGTVVEQVPIYDGYFVCFYDEMKVFSEADILHAVPSQV